MSRTMAGENMIKALDTRLTKVRSTSSELERVGAFYSRIIELCVSNPPKDNRHLRALEEQVRISPEMGVASISVLLRAKSRKSFELSRATPRRASYSAVASRTDVIST